MSSSSFLSAALLNSLYPHGLPSTHFLPYSVPQKAETASYLPTGFHLYVNNLRKPSGVWGARGQRLPTIHQDWDQGEVSEQPKV